MRKMSELNRSVPLRQVVAAESTSAGAPQEDQVVDRKHGDAQSSVSAARFQGPSLSSAWLRKAEHLAASRTVVYLLFAIVYAIPTLRLAHRKMLWDDEFFTLYLANTNGWHDLLRALATGADQHPPTFYYLTHGVLHFFGMSHVTLRLPAILGFGLLCLCLYELVRYLAAPLWAVAAMLFPLGTSLYYYATEARGYGLVSGLMALALLAWLKATSQERRGIWLVVLAASLAAATGCHYYAIVPAACLCLGELVRTGSQRRIDLPVWIALAFTTLPIAVFAKVIRSARGYSSHFWAAPVWSDSIRFYEYEVALNVMAVLGTVILLLTLQRRRAVRASSNRDELLPVRYTVWEATTLAALALLPLMVMVLAKFVTHGFADRYAISAVIGVAVLLTFNLYRLAPEPHIAMAAVLACSLMYVFQVHSSRHLIEEVRTKTVHDIEALSTMTGQNFAMMELTSFHRVSFYAPRPIASRVSYLSNPDASFRYLGQDTSDRGLLDLRPWFPIQVVTDAAFLRENPSFYAFGAVSGWNWLTFDLPAWGDTQLLRRGQQGALLFSVKHLLVNSAPEQPDLGASESLFKKIPPSGKSLCTLWMGAKDCL